MGNAVTNPGRFIEKKAFGVKNRDDSIFVNKDAQCRFAHKVVAPMAAENILHSHKLHSKQFFQEHFQQQLEKVGCKRP